MTKLCFNLLLYLSTFVIIIFPPLSDTGMNSRPMLPDVNQPRCEKLTTSHTLNDSPMKNHKKKLKNFICLGGEIPPQKLENLVKKRGINTNNIL